MNYVKKALHWAYGDSLRYIAFFIAMALFIGLLMTFIVYPVEVITFALIAFGAYIFLNLFGIWR